MAKDRLDIRQSLRHLAGQLDCRVATKFKLASSQGNHDQGKWDKNVNNKH